MADAQIADRNEALNRQIEAQIADIGQGIDRIQRERRELLEAAIAVVEACNPLPLNAKQHIAFARLTNAIAKAREAA